MSSWCGVQETLSNRANAFVCKWPLGPPLRWSVVAGLPGWSTSSLVQAYESAFALWSAVCAVRFEYTANAKNCNIAVGSRRMDGPFGILAEAELPCGTGVTRSTQLRVWMDTSEIWVLAENPQQGKIDLLGTAAHEFGHSLGIGHNTDGLVNSLMDPTKSAIRKPQNWDMAQAVMRYGNVAAPPDPEEPTDPGGTGNDLADFLDMLAKCLRRSPNTTEALNRWLS